MIKIKTDIKCLYNFPNTKQIGDVNNDENGSRHCSKYVLNLMADYNSLNLPTLNNLRVTHCTHNRIYN